jgi:hypothetical protein
MEVRSYQSTQVVPDFGYVWIEANSTGVRVERVAVLVNLVIKNSDRAPEGWVSPVTIDSLLVRFVRFGVLLLRHVASTQEVPALCVVLICMRC